MHGENAENYSKIGLEYYQKRRGLKLNMIPVSHRPGINKKNKRRTHKIERRFDKLLVKKESPI